MTGADSWEGDSYKILNEQIVGEVPAGNSCSPTQPCFDIISPVGKFVRIDSRPLPDIYVPCWESIGCITNSQDVCAAFDGPELTIYDYGLVGEWVWSFRGSVVFALKEDVGATFLAKRVETEGILIGAIP